MAESLSKGNYLTIDWSGDAIAFDGSVDDSTPGTIFIAPPGALIVEKASGSERRFYVSVPAATNAGGSATVSLDVLLPGSGGVGAVHKSSGVTVAYTVPVDHRAMGAPTVLAEQPLPHP